VERARAACGGRRPGASRELHGNLALPARDHGRPNRLGPVCLQDVRPVDAWVRLSLMGIELVTVEARVVVASITTFLGYSEALAEVKTTAASQPKMAPVKRSRPALLLPIKNFVVSPLGVNGSISSRPSN